jgi:hypothetical protein
MRDRPSITALTLILSLVCVMTPAHAIPVTVSFTASGFTSEGGGLPAPTDPVVGSIVYEAASITSNINSLTSVNLTIAGHTYTVDELNFANNSPPSFAVIGTPNGGVCCAATNGADTFFVEWFQATLIPSVFIYAAASVPGDIWDSSNFTQFSVTAAAVPEPSSLSLLLASAISLGIALGWKFSVK